MPQRTIDGAVQAGASLLLVHHGLFSSAGRRIVGRRYSQLKTLIAHDLALYSAHLPLDRHPTLGEQRAAREGTGSAAHRGTSGGSSRSPIGVRGTANVPTSELVTRASAFAIEQGGDARASAFGSDRRTHSWAICTGGGASADTLNEATKSRHRYAHRRRGSTLDRGRRAGAWAGDHLRRPLRHGDAWVSARWRRTSKSHFDLPWTYHRGANRVVNAAKRTMTCGVTEGDAWRRPYQSHIDSDSAIR